MNQILEVSPRDYHSELLLNREDIFAPDSYLSKSALWELNSTSLYRWRFAPRQFTGGAHVDWGTLIDCLITTPEELLEVVAIHSYDSFRTKEAREFKESARQSGKIVIHTDELKQARFAAEKITGNKIAGEIIERSKKQVIIGGKIKDVQFKGLVDLAPEGKPYLVDLKTTGLFSLEEFGKRVASLGYHVQAALYLKMWNIMFPDDQRNRFRFIWQNSTAPYEVAVTELATTDINAGSEYAAYLLGRLIKATKTNRWPNICDDKVAMIARPQYAMFAEEEKMEGVFVAPKSNPQLEATA